MLEGLVYKGKQQKTPLNNRFNEVYTLLVLKQVIIFIKYHLDTYKPKSHELLTQNN